MTQTESDKAIRYIQSLDYARSSAQWHDVPELARKVEKHAPKRKTLALVARTEASIPTTDESNLNTFIQPLETAIASANSPLEDIFQATVCLGWVHWLSQNYQAAADLLAKDFTQTLSGVKSQWVLVCISKQAFIRGFSLEKLGHPVKAAQVYQEAILLISTLATSSSLSSKPIEYRLWTERLLCRTVACTLKNTTPVSPDGFERILLVFHLWTSLFVFHHASHSPEFQLGLDAEFARWDMWMAYYSTLSQVLRNDYIYAPQYAESKPQILATSDSLSDEDYITSRLKQRTELKTVEARIESRLLEETSFPKATNRNDRVEKWADAVMENWKVLCGPDWHDEELGAGGKNAIATGVLDILYRAATKTFHSTQILRHLFTVHAYLAEFDLAVKALDSYLELVTRAKARSIKTGDPDYSLDRNDNVLSTMAEAITVLCKFGQRKDAQKARDVASKLKLWIDESEFDSGISETPAVNGATTSLLDKSVSAATIARSYHALGMVEAYWARLTYEVTTRSQHHSKALEYFRQATHRKYGNSKNLSYLYSLALLLARMRDITGALKVTKVALAEGSSQAGDDDSYDTERKLINFWHLFTLLLSARTDLLNAAKASTAAFEQFEDSNLLFGQQLYRSEHLNETEKNHTPALIDVMGTAEKIGILQVKMTQVALLEALEGPDQAVDASPDLLEMYVRLFGHEAGQVSLKKPNFAQKPPKTRLGTIKASLKRAVSRKGHRETLEPVKLPVRPQTAVASGTGPVIQVTDLSKAPASRGTTTANGTNGVTKPSRSAEDKHKVRRSKSMNKLSQSSSMKEGQESQRTGSQGSTQPNGSENFGFFDKGPSRSSIISSVRPSTAGSVVSRTSSFSTIRGSRHRKRDSRVSMQTIESDPGVETEKSLSTSLYYVPESVDKRHRTSTLIGLWLFISGMYCRSGLFDDSKDALDEAEQLVRSLELEKSKITSSAKGFSEAGWGGGKSVDELMSDVLSQVRILLTV
jgi:tetratricopeptide (TPR) repeat protein